MLEGNLLIIGLTGPIGAGCTTIARLLEDLGPKGNPRDWLGIYGLPQEIENRIAEIRNIKLDSGSEEKKTELLNELKQNLRARACFKVLGGEHIINFKRISMSELIVQLCFKNMATASGWASENRTNLNIYEIFKKSNELVAAGLELLNVNWSNLNKNDYQKIDRALLEIRKVTQYIKKEEIRALVEGKEKIFVLQKLGNNLRSSGNPFLEQLPPNLKTLDLLANEAAKLIDFFRHRTDKNKHNAFVIDAFRNPSEVDYFRKRYALFFLVSIFASRDIRRQRFGTALQRKFNIHEQKGKEFFDRLDDQDWGADTHLKSHLQAVSECFQLADIAITNDYNKLEDKDLFKKLVKYLALILEPGCTQPTLEETLMSLAYSLSLRSSCISRKVGAVITDKEGYVLGQGWNDCGHGQVGCGLLTVDDYLQSLEGSILGVYQELVKDFTLTSYSREDSICFKDEMSNYMVRKKLSDLFKKYTHSTSGELNIQTIEVIAEELKIKQLQYCRALHAEENALIQVARRGGTGVKGGTIYTTTFPCELCAKKIRQAGISRIVYTEPYPGSISEKFFLKDGTKLPDIKQFEGVKFIAYSRLFMPRFNKKEQQLFHKLEGVSAQGEEERISGIIPPSACSPYRPR